MKRVVGLIGLHEKTTHIGELFFLPSLELATSERDRPPWHKVPRC